MKFTVLIDNLPHPTADLLTEHGLSIWFEADGSRWLLDTGASGKFALNAGKLGIDIADIDFLVLSHAHADHTGGLAEFIRLNHKAKIYLSSHIAGNKHYSVRHGSKRDISMDYSLVECNPDRFVAVDQNTKLSENVSLICDIPHIHPIPKANRTLLENDKPDDFLHEMALVVDTPRGAVVLSSCSHHGVLNTLAACGKKNIATYIGGTHLIDSDKLNPFETEAEIEAIAEKITELYPGMELITGHCTGQNAGRILAETPAKIQILKTAMSFSPHTNEMSQEV
jgi:7,8-dihydropterin-6-yl-methyl-4-(beta-D-ribofuranosyl)aminobenzene 5'-phosphate synthase